MATADWLDRSEYPFASHHLDVGPGRMHYLDEGQGQPVLMVHGTPTWSFLYRHVIRGLAPGFRCIAPDNLGFGLSDKPTDWAYTPEAHAGNLEAFIDALGLEDFVLVVHDFGGPIGLSYAIRHPERVRALIVMNTWMWSNEGNKSIEAASGFFAGPAGRFLYLRLNLSARFLLKGAFADKAKLTPAVHRHYLAPFPTPAERLGPWVLARELTGSNGFYDGLWRRREALRGKPVLILWGMRDRLIGPGSLRRWEEAFPGARVVKLEGAGHFVQEEAPEQVVGVIRSFIGGLPERG